MSRSTAPAVKGSPVAVRKRKRPGIRRIDLQEAPYYSVKDQELIQTFLGVALADVEHTIQGCKAFCKGSHPDFVGRKAWAYWKNVRSAILWLNDRAGKRQRHLVVAKHAQYQPEVVS